MDYQPDELQGHPRPDLETVLAELETGDTSVISSKVVYGLDHLEADQIAQLWPRWRALDEDVRLRVLAALTDTAELNFEYDFNPVGKMALEDESALVRVAALELLFEDESAELMNVLLTMARADEFAQARAMAASSLGRFVFLGELEELPDGQLPVLQDLLFEILADAGEDVEVRRRALEAIANSTHEAIDDAIAEAYQSDEHRMRVSAVFAMGRTADAQWAPTVLAELESDDAELQYEAARAAGELELEDALPLLTQLAYEGDVETRDAAIWSLGEIGGKEAMRVLNVLSEEAQASGDEDLMSALEDAIATANLGLDTRFLLMTYDEDEPQD